MALATLAKSAVVDNPAVCSIGAPWGAAAPFYHGSPSYVEIDMEVVGVITELSLETMGTPSHVGANTYGQTTEVTIESSYNKKVWTPLPGGTGLDITKEGFAENKTLVVTRVEKEVDGSGGGSAVEAVEAVPTFKGGCGGGELLMSTSSDDKTLAACAKYAATLEARMFSYNPPDQHCVPFTAQQCRDHARVHYGAASTYRLYDMPSRACATVKVVPASPIAARYIRVTATRSV